MSDTAHRPLVVTGGSNGKAIARGLGWFSIGLGLVEVFAPKALGRAVGLERHAGLLRLFGLREIASGVAILAADDPRPWLWARVAGDGLDGALLAAGLSPRNPGRARTLLAILAVAPVVALDLLYASRPD